LDGDGIEAVGTREIPGGFGGIGAKAAGDVPGAWAAGAVALFAFGLEFVEMVDFAKGAEEILAEIGVGACFFGGDAAADAVQEDGLEEAVNLIGGGKGAGGLG